MTYHDKNLVRATASRPTGKSLRRYFRNLRKGVNDITLNPLPAHLQFGTLADDWRAVGEDMRKAMARVKGD